MRAQVRPLAMREWGSNSRPESLVRLKDGRFVVIADPQAIREGNELDSRFLARIDALFPSDNYEGLMVTAERDGVWNL